MRDLRPRLGNACNPSSLPPTNPWLVPPLPAAATAAFQRDTLEHWPGHPALTLAGGCRLEGAERCGRWGFLGRLTNKSAKNRSTAAKRMRHWPRKRISAVVISYSRFVIYIKDYHIEYDNTILNLDSLCSTRRRRRCWSNIQHLTESILGESLHSFWIEQKWNANLLRLGAFKGFQNIWFFATLPYIEMGERQIIYVN